ncbi:hypothetical protein C3747_169g88 [Trypanosoma cruzi]|uniref:Target of rapamycin (TOR) kinase 1 n=1 Tax=Trypanosoma cruzi TaxID=5693 RepID=A0A2V2W8A4_TRYCR|nr:hypothetical protein C3747_169g88 [Trypanosoma cruzi]
MQVWGLVGRSPFPQSSSGKACEGSRRIPTADAHLLRTAGIIEDALSTITGGWIIPFSVVEEKTTGLRRRWIAWPRDKKSDDPYEANVPLLHISHYLPPVMAEAASCLNLKASFFQVSLPRETRHLFRCRVEDGTLVELTRLPMGYKASPEILQIITTLAIAGVTTVAHFLWAAPPLVRDDVWIDDIRSAWSRSDATLWEAQVLRNADSCHAFMGEERESGATQYTFLGVQFDHAHRAVSLSDKFVRSLCAMPTLNSLTIAEWSLWRPAFCTRLPFWARIYVTTTFSSRQCDDDYPHLTGGLCRRHPRRTFRRQRLVWARDCDTSSRTIVSESSSPRKRHRPPSSQMHRSMDGEPFLFQTPATLKLPEENGRGSLFLSCRPRHARYA